MGETELKAKTRLKLKKVLEGSVVLRHEDIFTAGIPDFSITWNGKVCWIEAKHANPSLKGKKIQLVTMMRLRNQTEYCRYLIFHERKNIKETRIVEPVHVYRKEWMMSGESVEGFDYDFVADYFRRLMQ